MRHGLPGNNVFSDFVPSLSWARRATLSWTRRTKYAVLRRVTLVLEQLTFDDPADATKWKPVTDKLDVYFQPTINVIHQRCIFETLVEQPGQTVEEFVSVLHSTAKYCQFTDKEERIRDRLVAHNACELCRELEDHKKLTPGIPAARGSNNAQGTQHRTARVRT